MHTELYPPASKGNNDKSREFDAVHYLFVEKFVLQKEDMV